MFLSTYPGTQIYKQQIKQNLIEIGGMINKLNKHNKHKQMKVIQPVYQQLLVLFNQKQDDVETIKETEKPTAITAETNTKIITMTTEITTTTEINQLTQ